VLPVIDLAGSPKDIGRAHGEALRDRIGHNLAVYFDRFEGEGDLTRVDALARAEAYWTAIRDQSPSYASNLLGVAEASGHPLLEVVALYVRYEILYHQFTANLGADGCTAFAALPEATRDGHLLMGQNWDWIPDVQGAVLRVASEGSTSVTFTEAGIVGGKIGLNAHGVGLAINGLVSIGDNWARLTRPFHLRCYDIMHAADLPSAVRVVTDEHRSCSTNFLIGRAGEGLVNIEAAPAATCRYVTADGLIAHSNHFLDPAAIGVEEPPNPRMACSVHRLERMQQLLREARPVTVPKLRDALRDHDQHPDSVCRHPNTDDPEANRYASVTSVIMDLHDRVMWVTDGPPCGAPYQEVRLHRA
jgi:isopenicillin-N N-acyltransferase-like protein